MKPMVLIHELGVAEVDSMRKHAFDNALLEVSTSPGYLGRVRMMQGHKMERLSLVRRSSGRMSKLEFSAGAYVPRCSISSIVLATQQEALEAWEDRALSMMGMFHEMFICNPESSEGIEPVDDGWLQPWKERVNRLFQLRLEGRQLDFRFHPDARERFARIFEELMGDPDDESNVVPGHLRIARLLGQLSLCASLFNHPLDEIVTVSDVETAGRITRKLMADTILHDEKVLELREQKTSNPENSFHIPPGEFAVWKMVAKVRKMQPCTKRELFRSYSAKEYPLLQAVFDLALESCLILEDGKLLSAAEIIEVVEASPSKETSVSASVENPQSKRAG